MCDPLGVIGFVTGTVSSIALAAHVRKNLQNIKHELVQQEADVEILSLIVSEAERAFISHGRPSEAIRLAMEVCIQRKVNCEKSISWLQEIQALTDEGAKLSPLQRIKKVKVAFFDSHKRNQAFQSFRDSVLLLRDLSDRMYTHEQLNFVRTEVSDLRIDALATNVAEEDVEDWEPKNHHKDIDSDASNDVPREPNSTAQQSLVRILKDGFTFDGILVNTAGIGLKYIAVRGLMDSGCEAFLISTGIINRARITEAEMEPVADLEIHGLEGAACKPRYQIELTWYIRQHMNSRVSTFYVVDDKSFDIIIPSSLLINSRNVDSTGQAAYILHQRKKKAAEVAQEKKNQAEQLKRAARQEEMDAEKRRQKRQQIKKEKESTAATSNPSTLAA